MTKRLMTLLVVSGVSFFGVHAQSTKPVVASNLQEIATRTFDDLRQTASRVFDDSCKIVAHAASEVEQLAKTAVKKVGSHIDLHVSNQGNYLSVTTLGDGSDFPALALDGIKVLVQAISPEKAAMTYIKLYKEVIDDFLKTLLSAIQEGMLSIEDRNQSAQLFGKLMQSFMDAVREKTLDLAVMQAALPKDVCLECEAVLLQSAQTNVAEFYAVLNASDFTLYGQLEACPINPDSVCDILLVDMGVDKNALADFMSNFMVSYLSDLVEALVVTLGQHYTIDRAALGL